jgi:uncharacterized protein
MSKSKPKHTYSESCSNPKCLVLTEQLGDVTANLVPGPCKGNPRKGFASMSSATVSVIAQRGGKRAHELGVAHEFTSDEARVAGQRGGRASHAKKKLNATS